MAKECLKYLNNAKEILKKAPREGNIYIHIKPVREACGTAYLAILEAINEFLLSRGLAKKELPKSVDTYRMALRKYLSVRDGALFREFDILYDTLHIAGYYRGLIRHVEVIKDIFKITQQFIEKLSR